MVTPHPSTTLLDEEPLPSFPVGLQCFNLLLQNALTDIKRGMDGSELPCVDTPPEKKTKNQPNNPKQSCKR